MLATYSFLSFFAAAVIAAYAWGNGSIDVVVVVGQGVLIGMVGRLIQITSRLDRRYPHGGE